MKRVPLRRRKRLKTKTQLRRKKPWVRNKKSAQKWKNRKRRDWGRMTSESWHNAHGYCEWCGKPVPLGTAPAHIIPRSAGKKTSSDEAWNIACLCIECHNKFDLNRPAAIEKMKAEGGCPLYRRIQEHPRLKAYFDRLMERWKMIKRWGKNET